ncbi:MAG: hypothetical protein Kow0056_04200 [Coriobacteriia bacterium]
MMSSGDRAYRVALAGSLIALASVLGLVETALVPAIPLPGVRLGLANIAILLAAALLGLRWALGVSLCRVAVVGLASGTLGSPAALMALAGAFASWLAYAALSRSRRFSVVGWSVAGGAAHVVAQYATLALLSGTPVLLGLAPASVIASALCGLVVGMLTLGILSRTPSPLSARAQWVRGVVQGGAAAGR